MKEWKRKVEEIFLHFDDELGVFSATGSALAGAGLVALLGTSSPAIIGPESLTLLVGLGLIVLDYFR